MERPSTTHDPYSGGGDWQPRTPNHTIELLTMPSDAVEVEPSTGHTIELLTLPDDVVDVTAGRPAEPSVRRDVPAAEHAADEAAVTPRGVQATPPWVRLVVEACLVGAAAGAAGALLAYAMR